LNAYMPKAANPAKNTSWKMIQKVAHTSPSKPSILSTYDKISRIYHVDLSRDREWRIELRQSRLFCGKICHQLRPLCRYQMSFRMVRMKRVNVLADHEENTEPTSIIIPGIMFIDLLHDADKKTIPSKRLAASKDLVRVCKRKANGRPTHDRQTRSQ